jgi:hypothetical protein
MDGAVTFTSIEDLLSKSELSQDDDIYNSGYFSTGSEGEDLTGDASEAVPTKEEFEKLKKELADSLDAEAKLVERQIELHTEERDLKVAIENAQLKNKLAALQAQKEKLATTKESNTYEMVCNMVYNTESNA